MLHGTGAVQQQQCMVPLDAIQTDVHLSSLGGPLRDTLCPCFSVPDDGRPRPDGKGMFRCTRRLITRDMG